jgi:hypothetical protein
MRNRGFIGAYPTKTIRLQGLKIVVLVDAR